MEDRFEQNECLVYGKNAVTELLKSGAGVDTLFVADNINEATQSYYTALAKDAGAVVKRVHPSKLKGMCKTESHQGVACYAASIEYASVEDLFKAAQAKNEPPFIILADGVEDPHNLGAIIRTALLCGANGIVIPKRGGAQVTPIVHKTSAGASSVLPIVRVANIAQTVRLLKEKNVFVYCADMGDVPLYKQNLTGSIAVVMGNEGKGVSHLVKTLCDGVVTIPMAQTGTGVDSFNVSVAAGITMYEILRQRGLQK